MPVSHQQAALSIIDFLKLAVTSKQVSEDYAESMDVAIDCIADAFGVDAADAANVFGGKLLLDILSNEVASAPAKTATTEKVSEETRKRADDLKVQGNRSMASRDFTDAIAKYSEALALDPNNVIYLSNRAAAYTSNNESPKAIQDAQRAIEIDPTAPKLYSRLGLAQFSLGDYENATKLYARGLEVEGANKLEAMQRGYDTASKRYQEELESSMAVNESQSKDTSAAGAAGAGGMPDFSSMFGGGGMPNFAEMMNNPQVMQAAQKMMSDPDALKNLMSNPALKSMAQSMGMGGGDGQGPDLSSLFGGKK